MSRPIPRALGLAVSLLILVASGASGSEYRALLDLDADPATGCTVSTIEGPFPGVERIVISTVVGDEVIGVERRECIDPVAGTFGPPSAETTFPVPWPVGLGLGVGGTDLVETYSALPSCQRVRIGFETDDGLGTADALLSADGSPAGAAIIVDCLGSLEEIPTLTPWLLLLLSALVAGAGWLVLRRAPRAGRAALVVMLAVTVTGVAWAMILLDGSPTDWQALTSPARAEASDPVGDAASSADLRAGFAFGDRATGALFFRFDGTRNMVPSADPQDVTTDEDVAVLISLTASDPEGDALTFALDTSPEFGTLSAILPTGPDSAEVTYTPDPDVFGPDAFTFTVDDGATTSAPATVAVDVASINDAPVLGGGPFAAAFSENGAPVAVAPGLTVSDIDHPNLASATVTISNLADAGEEILAATPSGAIGAGDIVWVAPMLTIAPAGGAPLADFEAVLRTVTYENASDTPSEAPDRTLSLQVYDGADPSALVTSTVSVSATNDPPAIDGGPFVAAFIEEISGPVLVASAATLTDPDDPDLASLTVTITNLTDAGEEILAATPSGAIGAGDISWTAPVLTIAPASGALLADFEAVLRSVTYEHTGEAPSEAPDRSLELAADDGTDPSPAATSTITVSDTNDPPMLSTPAAVSFEEDAGPVAVASAIDVDDIDDPNLASATVEITNLTDAGKEILAAAPSGAIGAADITWVEPTLTIAPATGASLADFEAVLRSVTYENTSDTPSVSPARELTFGVDDGTDPSTPVMSIVRVASTNDRPEIDGGPFAAAFTEEVSGPVPVASTATLADPDDTELWSLAVAITNLTDAGEEILAATPSGSIGAGDITWVAPVLTIARPGGAPLADFESVLRSVTYEHLGEAPSETPDRTLSMVVHDGSDPSDPAASTVTVTGTNDPPTLSTPGGAAFVEDAGPVAVAPALAVGDVDDDELGAATVSLTNAQDGVLEVLATTACGGLAVSGSGTTALSISGVATRSVYEACLRSVTYENLSQAPTEAPGRSIELQAVDDGGSSSALVTSTVAVTGVNDPPAVGPGQSLVSLEDEVLPITVSGSDPEGDPLAIVVESIVLSAAGVGSVFSDEPGSGALAAGNTTTNLDVFFTPASNVFGNDLAILTYRLTDGAALSAGSATVTLDLTAVDDPVYATLPSELHGRQDGVINFILGGTSPEPDVWTARIVQIPSFNGTLYLIVSPTERIPIDSPGSAFLPGDSSTTQWPMQFVPIPGTCNSDPTVPYNSFSYRFFHDGPPSLEYEVGFFIACPTGLLTIGDASVVEGDLGTTDLTFTVSLSGAVAGGFNVDYSTVEGTATDGDYVPASGTLSFAGTDGESQTITVTVNGDGNPEAHETFSVELAFPDNEDAGWADSDNTGIGTIVNDD